MWCSPRLLYSPPPSPYGSVNMYSLIPYLWRLFFRYRWKINRPCLIKRQFLVRNFSASYISSHIGGREGSQFKCMKTHFKFTFVPTICNPIELNRSTNFNISLKVTSHKRITFSEIPPKQNAPLAYWLVSFIIRLTISSSIIKRK